MPVSDQRYCTNTFFLPRRSYSNILNSYLVTVVIMTVEIFRAPKVEPMKAARFQHYYFPLCDFVFTFSVPNYESPGLWFGEKCNFVLFGYITIAINSIYIKYYYLLLTVLLV